MKSRSLSTHKQGFAEHLRENMTWPEIILWSRLRHKQLGYSFQAQAIVYGYIVDFWCVQTRVVIEVDGPVHDFPGKVSDDEQKDSLLTKSRVVVLRFKNHEIREGMSAVLIRIWDVCFSRAPYPLKPIVRANPSTRYEETVEMKALRAFQQEKRELIHGDAFAQRYRAKRAQKNFGRWI